jgi:hypothetical protein
VGVSYSTRQATVCCGESYMSNGLAKNHVDNEVMQLARKAFCEEVHSRKQDETISVPKVLLKHLYPSQHVKLVCACFMSRLFCSKAM